MANTLWVLFFPLVAWHQTGWEYELAAGFGELGACHSASQRAERFAIGCASGVWVGTSDGLDKAVDCPAAGELVNRVRALDEETFVASTPCGLYWIRRARPPQKLPLPGSPGAVTSDGQGRLWVMVEGVVYELWPRRAVRRRLYRWPDERPPRSLTFSERGLVMTGRRCRLLGRRSFVALPPAAGARSAVWGRDRIIWIGARGMVWKQASGGLPQPSGRLPLTATERVRSVWGLEDGRVWVATHRRWFVLDDRGAQAGRLPPGAGRPVPVCSGAAGQPPWLVLDGQLLRPVGRRSDRGTWCAALKRPIHPSRAPDRPDRLRLSRPPMGSRWLPRIEIALWGVEDRTAAFRSPGGWTWRTQSHFGCFILLRWPLGDPRWEEADRVWAELERYALDHRRRRVQQVEALLATRARLCLGSESPSARLDLESVEQQLTVLGWGASKFRCPQAGCVLMFRLRHATAGDGGGRSRAQEGVHAQDQGRHQKERLHDEDRREHRGKSN